MFRTAAEIDDVLQRLGMRLLYADAPAVTIIVCGGSALQMLALSSRTTRDIDVCAAGISNETSPQWALDSRLPDVFMTAVEVVARYLGLSPGWLNTDASEVLEVYGLPEGLTERHMEDLRHRLRPSADEVSVALRWLLTRPTSAWFRKNIRQVVKELEYAEIAQQIPR